MVIVAAARTAIGTSRRSSLANMPAIELTKPVVAAVVDRSGLVPSDFDDLVLAESLRGGDDSARDHGDRSPNGHACHR